MSELVDIIARPQLYKVQGLAYTPARGLSHLDEGQLYAAKSPEDAVSQARKFWTQDMGFEHFTGVASIIYKVGEYRVILVHEDEEEDQ